MSQYLFGQIPKDQLTKILNQNAAEGWYVHTIHFPFERDYVEVLFVRGPR